MAEETGFKLALMETPKTGFLVSRPICKFKFLEMCNWESE